ncbi:M56 family metallopeptidase [Niabella beijingensis]|uniref:M56 family metallopeptidase n=1 Tax=Niabella beijingensis TaxID=2872700 RepID=UPI001CC188BC|nr:M56 family metallopeptidase [Niabella beijingensis]MBZ4191054.1 M56 family metallopeptidase [Niabella beijingensis]
MQGELYHLFTALGNALFSSVWQLGIIWLLITLYTFLRPSSDATNGMIRFAGLLAGFVLFIITFVLSLSTPQSESSVLKWMLNREWIQPLLNYGAMLYLVLFLFPLRNIIRSSLQLRQLRNSDTGRVPGALKLFMLDAAGYLNIKRKVRLFTSALVASPLTIGFLKPVILLPAAIVNQLTPQQLEAIILHELAHIKRNDYLINLITQIILTLLYFNPFARLLVKAQELDREKSADRWVLRFEYGQYMYASTLLQLAKNQLPGNGFALQALGKESQLGNRVQAIMGAPVKNALSFKKIGMLAGALLLSLGVCLTHRTAPLPEAASGSFSYATAINEPGVPRPVFAAARETDSEQLKYEITPIPAIEKPDSKQGDDIVYLKICEDANGKIKPPAPPAAPSPSAKVDAAPAPSSMMLFADHPTIVIPVLDNAAEEKIRRSIDAFKKLVTALSWKQLENSLAETVTEEQKKALKNKLSALVDRINWEENANMLRSSYEDIDWDKTTDQLKAGMNALFASADQYNKAVAQQKAEQQYHKITDSAAVAAKANALPTAPLRTAPNDSARKKVVDL